MNKRLFVFCIAMIAIWGSAHAEEFYFGAQGNQNITYTNMTISELRSMRDTLGFNVYSALSAWPSMLDMMDDYLKLIPDMYIARGDTGAMLEAFADYSAAHYAKVEAEDDATYQIRFRDPDGMTRIEQDGFAIAPYDPYTSYEEVYLDSLWYKHRKSIYTYGIQVRAVDGGTAPGDTMAYGDTIGFIKIWTGNWWSNPKDTLLETYYIEADTFLNAGSDTLYLEFGPKYRSGLDYIQIGTNNVCSLGVDFLKIYNEKGKELVENGDYIDEIDSFAQLYSQYVLNWHLRDEPQFLEWKPFRIIANALENCSSCSTATSTFNVHVNQSPKDFIAKANPAFLWPDSYPLWGGQHVDTTVYHSDSSTNSGTYVNRNMVYYAGTKTCSNWWSTPCDRSLQYNLDKVYIREMDSLYSASVSLGKDLWLFPQGFAGRHITHTEYPVDPDIDSIYYDADDGWYWRPPTESELSCVTFMGMCYPLKGLTYWRYDSYGNNPNGLSEYHMRGIIDTGLVRTELWYAIKNNIGPYINAIGDLFVTLDYDTSYTVHHGTPSYDPPPGAWLDSIRAVSNSPDSNPDLGWFHVGQFTEGGDKYVMIVNRACSQDTLNPAPAPSITATIKFDAGNLGLGDYVYVIDIATGTDSSDWDGTPDTTYSGKMPDGTIPFTTNLGPGEGRLFKIVGTSQLNLIDTINTNYTYQGKIRIIGDAIVPEDSTMNIRGPARFEILRCPTDSTGQDPALVEININGILSAIGTSSDSIIFYPDTAFECTPILGADPEPGDWYGIYFDQNAVGAFDYCSIQYATYGVEMRQNSDVAIIDCSIGNNSTAGIYNFGGYLDLINSAISYNDIYGLYGYRAADSVYNTKFIDNETYGIKIEGTNLTNDSTFLLYDTLSYVPSPSQYGILVDKNDYIKIEQCKISGYDQGAIRLTNSDALINNCDFTSTIDFSTLHGIYTENNSFPVVRSCVFDFVKIGAKAVLPSIPDLGDTSTTDGNNSFLYCRNYFIYFSGINPGQQALYLYAQNNWWGSSRINLSKLYDNPPSMVIVHSPNLMDPPARLDVGGPIPLEFSLNQNYPNPFNPVTTISFALEKPAKTIVTIYNILGQRVATPVNEMLGAGSHGIIWDGKSSSGSSVASGIYFYTIQSGDHFDSKKMLLLR